MACPGHRRDIAGIGIGCAGPLDPARGLINNLYSLEGWDRCDIISPFRERSGVPVNLENDAGAAAMGEFFFGAGRGCDPLVLLTFGTGVSGAAVIGGRLHRGAGGAHPEIGHIRVAAEGPECYCGSSGCLESLASGSAIGVSGKAAGIGDCRAVFAAAGRGEARVVRIIDSTVSAAAWILCHTFLPRRLVLGGGIMEERFDRFARAIALRLRGATMFDPRWTEVVPAMHGNDAGLAGAAGIALAAAAAGRRGSGDGAARA